MKSTSSAQSIHFGWATNKLCFSSFLSRKATTMQIYWLEMKWQFIIKSVQKLLQIHYLRLELMVNRRQPMPNRKQSYCKLGTEHRTLKQQCAPVFIITDVPKPISDQMTFKPHFKPIFQAMNSDVICKASHFFFVVFVLSTNLAFKSSQMRLTTTKFTDWQNRPALEAKAKRSNTANGVCCNRCILFLLYSPINMFFFFLSLLLLSFLVFLFFLFFLQMCKSDARHRLLYFITYNML